LSETSEKLDELPINRGVQGPPFRPARGSIIPCGRRPPILGDLPVADVADGDRVRMVSMAAVGAAAAAEPQKKPMPGVDS